ncbi:MAG: hypothetical protein MPJ50_04500, partial [Pirellulales bacterium]|nr:hypothetical protein [Pirellulales bacterium]
DFPLHYVGDEAANLLHGWTALWHPALIDAVEDIPSWSRADEPPEETANQLLVIPSTSGALLLAGWAKRAAREGAMVIQDFESRDEIIREALAGLDSPPEVDGDLAADFLALGYTYLQEELLTRQMRYMSNLDEPHFCAEAKAAAAAACRGDNAEAREKLQACFDVLAEARDRFYPVDAYFLDLILLAESSSADALRDEFARGSTVNLLASANVLEAFAAAAGSSTRDVLETIKQAIAAETCIIVGGDLAEDSLPLQPMEMTARRLRLAAKSYDRLIGHTPSIFARRRYGLSPTLPQTLSRCGFKAALHFTLDDGQFPEGEQASSQWHGPSPAGIQALTRIPLDVVKPETFVGLCERIGETMDLDHVATLVFARWPGQQSLWFEDLQRAGKYAPVLGRFATLEKYFEVDDTAPSSRFGPDRYRSPYLKQAIIRHERDPLSRVAEAHTNRHRMEDVHTLAVLRRLLDSSDAAATQLANTQTILDEIDSAGVDGGLDEAMPNHSCREVPRQRTETLAGLDECWPRTPNDDSQQPTGVMVFNPLSAARRLVVNVGTLNQLPRADGTSPVRAVQEDPPLALVDVPACGYAWVVGDSSTEKPTPTMAKRSWFRRKPTETPSLANAETMTLCNEFAQVRIDTDTGAIKSVRDYKHRGNRLSQQISLRRQSEKTHDHGDGFHGPQDGGVYSVMAADEVKVTANGLVRGEIVSKGRLLDREGNRLAGFEQTVRITRSAPVIELEIKLDIDEEPRADPWNSYYACRFAWPDVGLSWRRSVGMFALETERKRFEAPLFVEADTGHERTTVLCAGMPYHRVIDDRILDTMLICRGETMREFRLGIGIDLKSSARDALAFMSETCQHVSSLGPPEGPASGWLFHLDAANIVATHWDVIAEGNRVVGFRVRLLETANRSTRTSLRAMRKLKYAKLVDFTGATLADTSVSGDAVAVELDACEWVEVEAYWG